jgi:hypothetical protein
VHGAAQHFEEKWASCLNSAIKVEITSAAKVSCANAFLQALRALVLNIRKQQFYDWYDFKKTNYSRRVNSYFLSILCAAIWGATIPEDLMKTVCISWNLSPLIKIGS